MKACAVHLVLRTGHNTYNLHIRHPVHLQNSVHGDVAASVGPNRSEQGDVPTAVGQQQVLRVGRELNGGEAVCRAHRPRCQDFPEAMALHGVDSQLVHERIGRVGVHVELLSLARLGPGRSCRLHSLHRAGGLALLFAALGEARHARRQVPSAGREVGPHLRAQHGVRDGEARLLLLQSSLRPVHLEAPQAELHGARLLLPRCCRRCRCGRRHRRRRRRRRRSSCHRLIGRESSPRLGPSKCRRAIGCRRRPRVPARALADGGEPRGVGLPVRRYGGDNTWCKHRTLPLLPPGSFTCQRLSAPLPPRRRRRLLGLHWHRVSPRG
mmetsp:Transcript_5979/g.11411  ORF Transcript_5979/g.11411 Transcript_5979/m.11411 type:complete len:324 (+) Transcript_5979:430-1401(+)